MGEYSTLKRREPSLWRSAKGASRLAVTTAITRVRPSSTVQELSSSANCRRSVRSSKGVRPSMRCPSFSACKRARCGGVQERQGGSATGGGMHLGRCGVACAMGMHVMLQVTFRMNSRSLFDMLLSASRCRAAIARVQSCSTEFKRTSGYHDGIHKARQRAIEQFGFRMR